MSTYLILGGLGFVGSHLINHLINSQPCSQIIAVDDLRLGELGNLEDCVRSRIRIEQFDVSDFSRLSLLLSKYRIDVVVNCTVLPLVYSLRNPTTAVTSMIQSTQTILECARNGYFERLIHLSTGEVYGGCNPGELLTENAPFRTTTAYAAAKAACDLLIEAYGRSYGVKYVILRLFNQFGPRKVVLHTGGIIPSTIKRLTLKEPVLIYNRIAARDFVYVTDTVSALVAAIKNFDSVCGQSINIASGIARPIEQVVSDIARLMGVEPKLSYGKSRTGDIDYLCGSGEKAKRLLGFQLCTPWEQGLRECIDYYSSAGANAN